MTTVPTFKELGALFDQGMLVEAMSRRFGLSDQAEINVVEARCVELHNSGTFDLLQLVESGALRALNVANFFMAMHFFCQVLPELDATPARMMACVDALVTRGGEDMMANQPNAAFRTWCMKDSCRAREVIAAACAGDDLAKRHLTFALESINAVTESREIALSYVGTRRLSAITALGRMADNDNASRAATLAVFNTLLDSGDDDNLRANMLHATAAILAQPSDAFPPGAAALVGKLTENSGELTMHQAAHVLWSHREAMQPDIVAILLQALEHLNPANKGTVKELDHGLHALLELGHDELAIAYVTKLFSRPDDGLALNDFESFTRALVTGAPKRLSRVIVQWLLQGTPRLCEGLANAIEGRDLEGPPLDIRAEYLAISSLHQIFLCRKVIGWFFFKPITAASILVSVLRVCDAEAAIEVQNLLTNMLLLSYSGLRDYLEGLALDDAVKEIVDQALAENEAYLTSLRTIPHVKELQPSEHHRRIEQLHRADQMRDARKQAQSKSAFLSMVKHSVLLYGNRSISFIKDGTGALRPMEMDLKPYGFSFEIPRMGIVDPVGLDYSLRVFRMERIKS